MISADHSRFSRTSDVSLTIFGKIFSGPLVHTNDPSGTVLTIFFFLVNLYRLVHISLINTAIPNVT